MKSVKSKISVIRSFRIASQILFFIILPALYISTFSGIKEIYQSIIHQNFNLTELLPQIVEVIAIIPITILFGRFFCGWMCAFGTMGDFIYMLSLKLFKRKFKIGERTDRALKFSKYILLLFLIVVVWGLGVNTFSSSNPWDAFGMLLTIGKTPDLSFVFSNLMPALLILVFIVVSSFFVERFFCRYLCPLGAIFTIVSKLRITSILKPKAKCGNCRICTNRCPMGISLYKKDASKSGECINCFECVSACPRKNVSAVILESDLKPVLAGTMAVAVMAGVYYGGSLSVNPSVKSPTTSQIVASTPSNKLYNDGTYTGTGTGYRGATTVSVIVKADKITAVNIISYNDDKQFFNKAYPTVINSIVSKQTTDVNTVSGATYSSIGIKQAVANALGKAKLSPDVKNTSTVESTIKYQNL